MTLPVAGPSRFRRAIGLLAALSAAVALSACAGSNSLETGALAATPIPYGKARVTLTRPSTIVYAAVPAAIDLNGVRVASISPGGSSVIDVPAGDNTLTASAWSYPGTFSYKLRAVPGERYVLEVAPNESHMGTAILFGAVGGAIEASTSENTGAFQITPPGQQPPASAPDKS